MTVAHVLILDRDAPVRCDVLLDTPPARSTPRSGSVSCMLSCVMVSMTSQRRCLSRQGVLLLQPALPPFHLLQTKPSARSVRRAPPNPGPVPL